MTNRLLATISLLSLFLINSAGLAEDALRGKYLLAERPNEVNAPDAIEFRPDGSCLVDAGEHAGIAGKYHASPDGRLTIEAGTETKTEYSYKYQLLKYTLVLTQDDMSDLYYVRLPEGPHPALKDILGIFHAHNDAGDTASEIKPDLRFRGHLLTLSPDDRTYDDSYVDGRCSYADGVITYVPEHSDMVQKDKYFRDFVVRRDATGLWIIDPFHDVLLCETPSTNLVLPPPPKGYRDGKTP